LPAGRIAALGATPDFHHGLLGVPLFLWRISNHLSLTGEGSLRTPGRWHPRGRRVAHCAQSPAAALLEILVHFEIDIQDLPVRYRLLKIDAPDDVQVERVSIEQLPADWLEKPDVTLSPLISPRSELVLHSELHDARVA
jgi:RES domain-containing protein